MGTEGFVRSGCGCCKHSSHRKADVKGQIQSKETSIKYVVKFVSTLKGCQHLLPKSLALWMWLGAWGARDAAVDGASLCLVWGLGAPRLLGMPSHGSAPTAAAPGLH